MSLYGTAARKPGWSGRPLEFLGCFSVTEFAGLQEISVWYKSWRQSKITGQAGPVKGRCLTSPFLPRWKINLGGFGWLDLNSS